MTSKITYLGNLRTSSIHLQSGVTVLSDAPLDNHGQGKAFSPTDLVCNALGSCMMTIMAIKSKDLNLNLDNTTIDVTKHMQDAPRKIAKIDISINVNVPTTDKDRIILEKTAMNCPVLLSLNADIDKNIKFNWL